MLLCQVLSNDDAKFGYNAATGQYEDLMAAGIIDPTKVLWPCCLPSFLLALLRDGYQLGRVIMQLLASLLSFLLGLRLNFPMQPPFFFWWI